MARHRFCLRSRSTNGISANDVNSQNQSGTKMPHSKFGVRWPARALVANAQSVMRRLFIKRIVGRFRRIQNTIHRLFPFRDLPFRSVQSVSLLRNNLVELIVLPLQMRELNLEVGDSIRVAFHQSIRYSDS